MADSGKKIIEFISSDGGGNGGGSGSSSGGGALVPFGSTDLTPQAKQQAEQYGELLAATQAEAYARFFGDFFNEFTDFFSQAAERARAEEDNTIEGEFTVGGSGGNGEPPDDYDPFATSGFSDDIQKWLDDLEAEYRHQNDIIERNNVAFDELTDQADRLGEEEESLIGTTGRMGIAIAAVTAAAYLFHEALEDMVEAVGPFSASLNEATAEATIQRMEDQARAAEQIGDDAADIQNLQNEMAREMRDIWREGLDALAPVFKFIGEALVILVTLARVIVQGINFIVSFFEGIWDSMPDMLKNILNPISGIHKVLNHLKGNSDRSLNKTTNEMMDKLFGPGDIPFDIDAIKQGVKSGRPVTRPTSSDSSSGSASERVRTSDANSTFM